MIELSRLTRSFQGTPAVEDLSLKIEGGEFLTLLGPSGCGKTTTLRIIAGFETADGGTVYLDGKNINDLPPHKRKVNTVFQSYALFPHMNVFENVAFGLRVRKLPAKEVTSRVKEKLRLVRLEGFENRKIQQLSGGQRQRVAIARALANEPEVLLLDEPLGALDLKLRREMQMELKQLQQRLRITFVMVTHDQEESLNLSDRIAVMNRGRIEQLGTPREIYDHPASAFVADFIGETNFLKRPLETDSQGLYVTLGENRIEVEDPPEEAGTPVTIAIRPERLRLLPSPLEGLFCLPGKVTERIFCGSDLKTLFALDSGEMVSVIEPSSRLDNQVDPASFGYIGWEQKNTVVLTR